MTHASVVQVRSIRNVMVDKGAKRPFIVAIAGPSGSGKSKVSEYLQAKFSDVLHLSLDDYFKDPRTFPKCGKWINWELPDNLDFNHLSRDLTQLREGRQARVPDTLNPTTYERRTRIVEPCAIVIVEGFLVLYDENTRRLFDCKIFIDAPEELQIKRRLERTVGFLATHKIYVAEHTEVRDPDSIEQYIRLVVVPNYRKYVLPTKKYADYVVDGSSVIENVVLKVKAIIEKFIREREV